MASKTTGCYINGLDNESRARYVEKISIIGGKDPHDLPKHMWTNDVDLFLSVTYPDIVNYLLFVTSAYTMEELQSYKGLEAYNQFVSGWVHNLMVHVHSNNLCVQTA